MSNKSKMTSLGGAFDATQVAPQQPMEAIPSGWYPVTITDGEVKPTKDGSGTRLELEFTVLDGPFKGRKVFDGLNISNPNPVAQEIAHQQLSAICHATGVLRVSDVQELFNKPLQIKVDVEGERADPNDPSKKYEAKNRFKGAKALEGGGAPAPSGAPSAAAPAWATAKPGTPAPAPAAAPAKPAVTVPAAPPWAAQAPAAPAAPAPTAPAPAAPAAPAKAPKGPKKPGKAAAPERKFYVYISDENMPVKTESEVAADLAKGMPADTPLLLEQDVDSGDWKDAAHYGIATPAPAAATPAGAPVAPPWAR